MADSEHAEDGGQETGTIDDRVGKIETEQERQGGMLEQILARLEGDEKHARAAAQEHTQQRLEHPPAETIAAQVRAAVADVDAERAAREQAAQHDAEHKRLQDLAEHPPRERAGGWRGRLQTVMFGAPDA